MQKRAGFMRFATFFAVPMASFVLACFAFSASAHAVQSIPYKMNFQGRLTNTSGITLSGSYDMQLKFYTAATGGSFVWGETRTAANGNAVTVTSGLFSVLIGEGTAVTGTAASLQAALAANQTLYLEMTVGTEVLSPRNQVGSAAYAFTADTLDGIDSSAFAQTSSNTTFTGTLGVSATNTAAFTVTDGGTSLLTADTSNMLVKIGTADAAAQVLVLDSNASDPGAGALSTNGAMYYNSGSGKFRCYQGGAWADCVTAVATLQSAYTASGTLATITTTAAKGVAIVAGAAPTADMLTIDNSIQPTVTDGVSGVAVNYAGGAAAVEGSGIRVDYTPGSTSGGTWNGLHIIANATGPASGVTANGIKLQGPTTPGAGTEVAVAVGTGWDIGVDIQSGGLQLAAQNDPATPAAGNLRIYAKDIAGRVMPKWIGPAGVDTPMQASLGFNRVSMVVPAGGSTLTTFVGGFGTTFTNTGTAANPTPASTNMLTSVRRATFSSGTTAGTVASHRQSVLQVWRGNAAGRGGFFYTIRFGTSALVAGNRAFVGLSDVVSAPTNVDPTTSTTPGKIGVAVNANTGNWKLVNNVTGTAPAVLDLGSTMPLNTTDLYELVLYSPPNGSSIGYRLKNITTNNQVTGSLTTNIPTNTTFLAPQFWITNNATAAAAVLDFSGWYLESDN